MNTVHSLDELKLLGKSARDRRNDLELSLNAVSAAIGVNRMVIWAWEECFPSNIEQDTIERWESILAVPKGWLLNHDVISKELVIPSTSKKTGSVRKKTSRPIRKKEPIEKRFKLFTPKSISAANEIHNIATELLRSLDETEIPTKVDIVIKRYGVDGYPSSEYNAIASQLRLNYGLVTTTFNRIRRIAKEYDIESPFIDALLLDLLNDKQITQSNVDQQIRQKLGKNLSLRSLIWFVSDFLGKEVPQALINLNDPPAKTAAEEIVKIAKLAASAIVSHPSPARESSLVDMFSTRYGVFGDDNAKFEGLSRIYGMSHQGVMSNVNRMRASLAEINYEAPVIRGLMEKIESQMPSTIDVIEEMFRHEIGDTLSMKSLDRFIKEVLNIKDNIIHKLNNANKKPNATPKIIKKIKQIKSDFDSQVNIENAKTAAEEIRKTSFWITNNVVIYYDLKDMAIFTEMFSRRYGVSGDKGMNYRELGELFEMSPENVRKMTKQIVASIADVNIQTPFIKQLLENINDAQCLSDDVINRMFRKELGESLTIKGLRRFAKDVLHIS